MCITNNQLLKLMVYPTQEVSRQKIYLVFFKIIFLIIVAVKISPEAFKIINRCVLAHLHIHIDFIGYDRKMVFIVAYEKKINKLLWSRWFSSRAPNIVSNATVFFF